MTTGKRFCKKPWGWYLTLIDRDFFKVKLLRFYPTLSCSRQYHNKRHELWLWLSGTGLIELDSGMEIWRTRGDYHPVPLGTKHKYTAIRKTLVLEIQYGRKCEEKDIVRL